MLDLDIKDNFYKACAAHGLSYPKTATCTAQNYKDAEFPFDFPVIIKASNSPAYWNCSFPHKKKVFLAMTGRNTTLSPPPSTAAPTRTT